MAKAPKLTDLQLILLSTASQREAGNLLPLSESAAADMGRTRKDIASLLKRGLAAEAPTSHLDQVWREEHDQRLTVVITDGGRTALGIGDGGNEGQPPADETEAPKSSSAPRAGSKKALLIEMLRRRDGASLNELVKATSWLPHTTRAPLTGLRKAGHNVTKDKVGGVTRYKIETAA